MGDMGEIFREMREEQKERRAKRLPVRAAQILSLRDKGYMVEELSPYQFRVNGIVDLYPTHNRYHHLKSNRRGGYRDAVQFVLQNVIPLK